MKDKLIGLVVVDSDEKIELQSGLSCFIDIVQVKDENEAVDMLLSNKDIDAIITNGETWEDFPELAKCPFEIRKKWVNVQSVKNTDLSDAIINVFLGNVGRLDGDKLFSIFTCLYKTPIPQFFRLYESLKKQTYHNWNWWIIDDSPEDYNMSWLYNIKDSRITIIKNGTNHGSIGFNKHTIAMACDGDYLVEVDHDDELTDDCLQNLYDAFCEYPESKFVYSDTLEMVGEHTSVNYNPGFSCGQGRYKEEEVNGWLYKIAVTTPSINARSIRSIHSQPNHVRAWEKNFYHSIGGHSQNLAVCDDMELLIRTFLGTRMTHINKVLYIQYEYDRAKNESEKANTQTKRYNVIQNLNYLLLCKYDEKIHNRILELGFEDTAWDDKMRHSILKGDGFEEIDYGYQFYPVLK